MAALVLFTVDHWRDGNGLKKGKKTKQKKWESHDILFVTKQWHGYSVWGKS